MIFFWKLFTETTTAFCFNIQCYFLLNSSDIFHMKSFVCVMFHCINYLTFVKFGTHSHVSHCHSYMMQPENLVINKTRDNRDFTHQIHLKAEKWT